MKYRCLPALILLVLAAVTLSGCSLLSRGAPVVETVTLTDQVDGTTKAALRPLTGFHAGVKTMYASVLVRAPRKGTRLEAQWYYDKLSDGHFMMVDQAEAVFDRPSRDRYAAFSLTAMDTFPAGPYKLQVYLDGAMVKEVPFTVQ